MKRPFGFDSALNEAESESISSNMTISKKLVIELDEYMCQLEVKCDGMESQLQPHKTVKDAVVYYDEVWPNSAGEVMVYDPVCDQFYLFVTGWTGAEEWYEVCTREEFEAEVERRKGDEWTHVDQNNHKCKIIHTDVNLSWVQYSAGNHCVVVTDYLEKRKTTITKAEAFDKLCSLTYRGIEVGEAIDKIHEEYEIK